MGRKKGNVLKHRFKTMIVLLGIISVALVGCTSGTGGNATPGGETSNNEASSSGASSGNEASASSSAPSEAPAEEPRQELTLNFFLDGDANAVLPANNDDFVRAAIEEKFNVKLNVESMAMGTDFDQKLNLKISSGETPDLFVTSGGLSSEYAKQGILANLAGYVTPEKMPNYFTWVTEQELNQFQLAGMDFVRAPRAGASKNYFSLYIRKDWLDKLALVVPSGYEQLTSVMKAFTFNDPDGNGKQDTYGFSTEGQGRNIPFSVPQFRANGIIGTVFVDENFDFHDGASDPKLDLVVEDLIEWIDAGIIDPDWFLNPAGKDLEKFAQGRVGMVYSTNPQNFAFESVPTSIYSQLKTLNPDAEIIPINPFPDVPNFVAPYLTMPFLISKATADTEPEKVERILEIIDWLCSEEGFLLTQYGVEGREYTRSGNAVTVNPDAIQANVIDKGNFLTVWDFMTPNEADRIGLELIDPRVTDRDRTILRTIDSFPLAQGLGTSVSPPAGMSVGDFRNKLYEYQVKMVFEDKNGANWPEYREVTMTEYRGREMLQGYVEQMRAVGIKVNDFK